MLDEFAELGSSLKRVLDSHGYSFHYAVLREAERLLQVRRSEWVFEVAEFPVSIGSRNTRIDFVLRHPASRTLLVAECKRANPSIANWCFLQAPYRVRGSGTHRLMFERMYRFNNRIGTDGWGGAYFDQAYDLGFELRTKERGDPCMPNRGAIDDAATQVMTAVNGLVSFMSGIDDLVPNGSDTKLLPAIFTTARLFGSTLRLSEANLATGVLPGGLDASLKELPWLILQYPQSSDLVHSVAGNRVTRDLSTILEVDISRSVAIVSTTGIEAFLKWAALQVD